MNRGRIQAQGQECQESEAWSQSPPPTKTKGKSMSKSLQRKLSKRELKERRSCFEKLDRFIKHAPHDGYDTCHKSFTPFPPKEDTRVDVEIIKGKAFCDDGKQK